MTHTDEEIRYLAISLLKAQTARDKQVRVGASNLSNQCDRCLAYAFLGQERTSPILDQAWMGRVLGTAFHGILEDRITDALKDSMRASLIGLHPGAAAERHVWFADFAGYGPVGGTIDADLGEHADHIIDWKGSTRKRICILRDYLATQQGLDAPFGRTHTWVKLSQREYDAEMQKMAYKVTGYYGQANLYMRGAGRSRASLVLLARDGTGMFDNPEGQRYTDPKAVHDVFVLSFDYDPAYTDALIARGQAIVNHLAGGGSPADLSSQEHCFICEKEAEESAKAVDMEVAFATSETTK